MAFKQAKIKQTDYTKGGRDISNTSVPLYQNTLRSMDDYLQNPTSYIDNYLDKYYTNSQANKDFLTDYQRAMANTTSRNYNATGGGYSSSGQRAYDDTQRYMNDYAARLRDAGVQGASDMANQWYNNALQGSQAYNNAYKLGETYSKYDQYNDLVDQSKNNWIGNVMNSAGSALMTTGNPIGLAIGGALSAGSGFIGTDTSSAMNALGMGGSSSAGGANTTSSAGGLGYGFGGITQGVTDYFKNKNNNVKHPWLTPVSNPNPEKNGG